MTAETLKESFPSNKRKLGGCAKAFLYGLVAAAALFLPFMAVNQGYFLYYGDFNVQQVPFYQMCHDAILSGNIKWSSTTDLGANFIGSYSFYLLGSPFFYLTLLFPSSAVPYLMGPLLILKFACASLTSFLYIRRYTKREITALIGALLYAFSGYSVYNVFFNHFHETIVFFPLLLYSIDEYMYKRKRGLFALSVFACCFVNYYFFVGQVTFALIYWIVGLISKRWNISVRDAALMFMEAVLGVLMSSVLLIPSCLAVLQNPRVDNSFDGWNALLYNVNQRYVHIIECFFFPPDIPARPNFTPDSQSKWSSLGAWLPLFSMTGVVAWFHIKKNHYLKKLLLIFFFMALVPVLNSSFQLLNSSYYARWFYMLTLLMVLATVKSLEDSKAQYGFRKGIIWTSAITVGISCAIGFMPHKSDDLKDLEGNPITVYGLEEYPTRFWSYVAIALISLCVLSFLFAFYRKNRTNFYRKTLASVFFISLIYSIFVLALGKTQSADPATHIIPYALNSGEDVDLPEWDTDAFRIDFYESLDNSAMFWQKPSIQAFHSIVPGSIMEFYPSIGVKRDVGSRADTTHYGLRALTSTRWLFDDADDKKYFGGESKTEPAMPGWTYYGNMNGFDVWENEYYVPMGFYYNFYVTPEEYYEVSESNRELLLLKAMVMTNEQAESYFPSITHLDNVNLVAYNEKGYFNDCETLKNSACDSFAYSNDGFTAEITTDTDKLLFFSVPYESGWSAEVNGEPAKIEKVSIGFMAVKVPAGTSEIAFTYKTPGLSAGIIISAVSALILIIYLVFLKKIKIDEDFKRRKCKREKIRPFSEYKRKSGCEFTFENKKEEKHDDEAVSCDTML